MNTSPASPFEIIDRSQIHAPHNLIVTNCQDCACAVSLSPLPDVKFKSLPITAQDIYHHPFGLCLEPLKEGYWTAFNPLGEAGIIVLNQAAYELLHRFKQPASLTNIVHESGEAQMETEAALARLIALGLLQPPGIEQRPTTGQTKLLTVWLHITNQCNLRCTYCYLYKTNEHMSQATGRAAIDAVIRSALAEGYQAIKLKYGGGEASLKMERVFEIHDYALAQCQAYCLGLESVILSNGTALTTAGIEGLKKRQIKVMVSLDGLNETHNIQRPYAGGQSSARQVIIGIEKLIKYGLPPHLSITITAHNCQHVEQVVQFALTHDLTFSLNFYRENECSMSFADLQYTEAQMVSGIEAAYRVIAEKLPPWSIVGAILDRGHLVSPHEHACGVTRDYLVIDHRGNITKCQMEMDKVITDINHPNPMMLIRSSSIGVQSPSSLEKEGCRDCEWRYWCSGGCPIATYRATGRYDVKSPNCNIYKALYPKAVQLEGLRLLKYATAANVH